MNKPTTRISPLKSDSRMHPYFRTEEERRSVTQDMFNQAAPAYDYAESLTAFYRGTWYRRQVLLRTGLVPGMTFLDVAAGTGLVTVAGYEIAGPQGRAIALDPSPGMLAQLRKKIQVETIEAYAESIRLPDALVDFLSMGYALRHVEDLDLAIAEYRRVLRPGGRVCIMEISRPNSALARALLRFHIKLVVPLLAKLTFHHASIGGLWAYYGDTIEAAVVPDLILDALRRAGFSNVGCTVTLGILREYTGFRR